MSLSLQILQNCLSPDNIIRNNAEKELHKYCEQNLFQAFIKLCNFIAQGTTPGSICRFCGTLIKYIFSKKNYILIWNTFSKEQIDLIKTELLSNLASEKEDIKRSSSLALAAMAGIEIPKGWDIIDIICNAAIHQNINYKITSLITLQNILDFIGKDILLVQDKQKILGALTTDMSINEPTQVINEAILGYEKIIPFIEDNFKNNNERDFMINRLLNLLDPNYINKLSLSEILQKNILICIIKIIENYAKYLCNNFSGIANMSFRYFNCNNKSLSTLSIELWSTVSDAEIKLKENKISSNYQDQLYESIIRIIETREYYPFEDSDDWNPIKASINLLCGLSSIGNKNLVLKMINYRNKCLNNELVNNYNNNFQNLTNNQKMQALFIKETAYIVYRGILFSKDIINDSIIENLNNIIKELKDEKNIPIANSMAFCLIIICKNHFYLINDSQEIFDNLIQNLIQLLQAYMNNKKILDKLLTSVKHILRNSLPEHFNKHLTSMINILLKIAYDKNSYNKDLNLTKASMFFIGQLIEKCEDSEENNNIIQLFFTELYNRFLESLNPNKYQDKIEQICFQDCILSLIVSCGGEFQKIKMNETQFICVYNLIDQCLKQRGYLFHDAILALGSLAYFGWNLFSNINNNVMNYILLSLEERQDFQLCYQGLLAADDIIRCLGKENLSFIPKIVEKIQKIINDPNIPKGLKIKCFCLYNDIFMIGDESNKNYLQNVIQLLIEGMNSSIQEPSKDDDEDTLEYLNELREKIVELLTGVFMYLRDYNQINVFSEYIQGFVKYLSTIVEPQFNSSIDLISEVCGLLGDLYRHFKGTIDLYFEPNSLKIIFDRLEESSNTDYKTILSYSREILSDLVSNYNL